MANINLINKAVEKEFPDLDIEVVRGEGYFYFDGDDGFDVIESIMAHPSSTSTDNAIDMVRDAIIDVYGSD